MVITGAPRKRLARVSGHVGSNPTLSATPGEMTEWLKVHAWKACVRVTVPWVRIPLSPPTGVCCRLKTPDDKFMGPKPCALQSREPRQAREGATVSEPLQVPQVNLGPILIGS